MLFRSSRYLEVTVHPEQLAEARALRPMNERQVFGRPVLLFDQVAGGLDRSQLGALGEARTPNIADLFAAVVGNQIGDEHGAKR